MDIRENEPSFAISALSDAVVEGDNLTFTIAIDGAVQNSQMVSIEFSGDTSFIAGELTREVEFLPTTRAKPLFIATNDNTIHNESGIITATIVADSSYGTNDASVSVQILDDETPTISLTSELTESYEEYSVDFEISADRSFALDLNVQVEFSPAELVVGPAVRTISLLASDPDLTQTFNIQLVNDQIHNKRRTLTATLLDGGNYNINEEISNQVNIAILEDDIPMLYIAGEGVISEDESLEFEVLSTTLPETDTLIQFTPTETGSNFLAIPSGQPMIEQLNFVDDNEVFVATLAIPIDDDDLYEADGSISVTLNTAEGYISSISS